MTDDDKALVARIHGCGCAATDDEAASADAITRLSADLDAVRASYHYIGKDGKTVSAASLEDERDALRAENERLREALAPCLTMLDGLVAESGRGIDYGHEDAFRMGEWFEESDLADIDRARAALSSEGVKG